jgi:hypothetical protein
MEVTVNHQLETFFSSYQERFNQALGDLATDDVEGTASAFADFFVEASPVGVSGGKNDDEFRAMIPKGNAFYRSIGTQSMKIEAITITPLDDFHVQAKVSWHSEFKKKDGSKESIDFDVIYFLQILDGPPKIFAFITGDEQKAYKEKGIVPESQ